MSHRGRRYREAFYDIYIYILVCSCAYPCTDECGSDVKVGLVVKLIGGKVWITNSITRANEMWARSPRLALSRRTLHYLKVIWTTIGIHVGTIVEVGTISAYLSLSKNKIWTNICKVDVLRSGFGQISSNVGLIGSELGPKLNKVGTIESGFGTKFDKVDTIRHPN